MGGSIFSCIFAHKCPNYVKYEKKMLAMDGVGAYGQYGICPTDDIFFPFPAF